MRVVPAVTLLLALAARPSSGPAVVLVSDVEALYAAVNNPGNAGVTVVLAPGQYSLSVLDPHGAARPNAGRLELQPDMSLAGVTGHPEEAAIDSTALPASSFALGGANTGTIRLGRGRQSIEWLTVVGGRNSAAGIETDLVGGPTAVLRVAHVISRGAVRGIDVRNLGAASAGRVVTIDVDDCELTDNTHPTQLAQGIRFVNQNGAHGAAIVATLRGTHVHDNMVGFLSGNLASSGASVRIDSYDDRFDDNQVGGIVLGGVTQAPGDQANDNTTTINIHAGSVSGNAGSVQPNNFLYTAALSVVGGLGAVAGATSRNTVSVSIWGARFEENGAYDVQAWGARTNAPLPAGTDNVVVIDLQGVSAQATTSATASTPADPSGTNHATIR